MTKGEMGENVVVGGRRLLCGVICCCGWRRMLPAMVRREFWIGQDLVENKLWLMHFFVGNCGL